MKNTPNPNRARSRRNPKGKRHDPPIDWPNYNKGRKSEGKYYNDWMAKVADNIHEILDIPQGEHDRRISSILVSIVKSEEKLTCWGLVKYFEKHPRRLGKMRDYQGIQQVRVSASHISDRNRRTATDHHADGWR